MRPTIFLPSRLAALLVASLVAPFPVAAQAEAAVARGRQAVESRRYSVARAELEPYARANPRSAEAAFWLGRAQFAEGHIEDAKKSFERAAELEPNVADHHLWLGHAVGSLAQRASKLKQPFLAKQVQRAYARAAELDPRSVEAREGLLDFYSIAPGIMGGSMEKAHEQLAAVRKMDALRGHELAARLALRAKDTAAAERELAQAVAAFPDSARGHLALASFHSARGDHVKALAQVEALLARRPDHMPTRYAFGRLAAISGQKLDRGEQYLREYLGYTPGPNEPSHAGAHFRIGMIQEKRGQKADAIRSYESATRLDPKLTMAKEALAKLRGS